MKHQKPFIILLIFAFVGLSALVFNNIYSSVLPKIVEEVNNSAIGAILGAIITVLLLNQQSASEELRERNVKVFEKKSENFSKFIEFIWDKWSDFKIEPQELLDIRTKFYKDIYIYLDDKSLSKITESFKEISKVIGMDLDDQERREARNHIFKIIGVLKKEIGLSLSNEFDPNVLDEIDIVFEKAVNDSETKEIESKIETSGKTITFWHFIAYDDKQQREVLKLKKILLLGDSEKDGPQRTSLLKRINKDDVIFLYSRGYGYTGVFIATEDGISIPKGDNRRVFMRADEGHEGHIAVDELLLLNSKDSIGRDAPRLKTIQRIYDVSAINKILTRFKNKAVEVEKKYPELLNEIERVISAR